jgi:hypothetical protein
VIVLLEFESIDQNLFRCHPNHWGFFKFQMANCGVSWPS